MLKNTLDPRNMPPIPKSAYASDRAVTERPRRFRLENWDKDTPLDRFVAAFDRAATCEIGASSLIDAVDVTPANGPKFRVGRGARMPAGDWTGPFLIDPARKKTVHLINPSLIPTWRTEEGRVPGLGNRIELLFYPTRELAQMHPVQTARAPLVIAHASMTGPGAATPEAMIQVPTSGRKRVTFSFKPGNQALDFQIWGAVITKDDGTGQRTQLWPSGAGLYENVPASVTDGEDFVIENEHWEYLIVIGNFTAGANGVLSLHVEAQDEA